MRVLVAAALAAEAGSTPATGPERDETAIVRLSSSDSLIQRLQTDKDIDAAFFDFEDAGANGLRGVQLVSVAAGPRPVGVLVTGASLELAKRLVVSGAHAVLPTHADARMIADAARMMVAGHVVVLVDKATPLEGNRKAGELSERELQILAGVCAGQQNKEIAHALKIQEVTVKMHVRAIIRKLGARNRTHAAMIARDLGIC